MKTQARYTAFVIASAMAVASFQNCSPGFGTAALQSRIASDDGIDDASNGTAEKLSINVTLKPESVSSSRLNSVNAVINFAADIEKTECQLNDNAFETCNLPITYADQADGNYELVVRITTRNHGQAISSPIKWRVAGYAPLTQNPFGVGAHHIGFDADNTAHRTIFRTNQFQHSKDLVGFGGYIRIWCHIGKAWTKPFESGPQECAKSVQLAHDLNLVPVVVLQDAPIPDPDEILIPSQGYKKFTAYAKAVKDLVLLLPRPENRVVWIEMANEPNFTDWWATYTCSWKVRAWEVARQTLQLAEAVRSINDSKIKLLGPSISPYGDSDIRPTTDRPCKDLGRGKLDVPSYEFLAEMKKEEPGLFKADRFDAWNSHAYPDHIFGICDVNQAGSCLPFSQQHGMTPYRRELQTLGLPENFPIFLTEASIFDKSTSGSEKAAVLRNQIWSGVYTDVWLATPSSAFNNVKAVLTYVLSTPYNSDFDLMGKEDSLGPKLPMEKHSVLFQKLYNLRKSTLFEGILPQGKYRRYDGTVLRADGNGKWCVYSSHQSYLDLGGRADFEDVRSIYEVPSVNTYTNACK